MTLTQYARAVAVGVKYIGGQYQYRDHVGDRDARGPFVNVPKARQERALGFITEYGFGQDAFDVPRNVLREFGANRWSHWGNENTIDGRIDYPLLEQVLSLQRALLSQLIRPSRLARILDAELKYGSDHVVTIPELFLALTESIWSEVWSGTTRNVTAGRRDLQRAYVALFTELVVKPPSNMPADARSVARHRLADLERRIGMRLGNPDGLDAYTVPHLEESRARIGKALDAGLQIQEGD